MSKRVNFKITSIDSLGQGVSKENGEIVFIPKTLPQEEGQATITASKKSISFAHLDNLTKTSPLRQESVCPHFNNCGGCDYLHTSYDQEITFKKQSIIDIFARQFKIDITSVLQVIKSDKRLGYRNRVQLHYNKKQKTLGFKSPKDRSITPVPSCRIAQDLVEQELTALYKNDSWQDLVKKHKAQGHIEIYERDHKVSVNINKRYAHEGFTQVNAAMNTKMLRIIEAYVNELNLANSTVLDLFGGAGNLSNFINHDTCVVDATPSKYINLKNQKQFYVEANLFDESCLETVKSKVNNPVNLTLIDPPRSGFKQMASFVEHFCPEHIVYVSCNPQTLARDLSNLPKNYQIIQVYLLDFFPATRHFESMAIIKKVSN